MRTASLSADAKNNFGDLIELSQGSASAITKYDPPMLRMVDDGRRPPQSQGEEVDAKAAGGSLP